MYDMATVCELYFAILDNIILQTPTSKSILLKQHAFANKLNKHKKNFNANMPCVYPARLFSCFLQTNPFRFSKYRIPWNLAWLSRYSKHPESNI